MDQDGVAPADPQQGECDMGGLAGGGERARLLPGHAGRLADQLGAVDGDELGVAVQQPEAQYLVADLPAVAVRPEPVDHPGELVARDGRQLDLRPRRRPALPDGEVGGLHPGRVDPDPHLAPSGGGGGHLGHPKYLGAAETGDGDSLHLELLPHGPCARSLCSRSCVLGPAFSVLRSDHQM